LALAFPSTEAYKVCKTNGPLFPILANKLVQSLWKSVWQFLRKLDIILPDDPAIPLLGIYTDVPTGKKDTCSTMFIAALFIIARSLKEPRCPSTEEWIQKMWYICTMEYYSVIKNNEFMKFLGKWMDLEHIILSEVTQAQQNTHDMHSLIRNSENPIKFAKHIKLKTKVWIRCSFLEWENTHGRSYRDKVRSKA
jgi:hypothetical protein